MRRRQSSQCARGFAVLLVAAQLPLAHAQGAEDTALTAPSAPPSIPVASPSIPVASPPPSALPPPTVPAPLAPEPTVALGPRPDRRLYTGLALGSVYAGFATWAYFAWYHNQDRLLTFKYGGDGYFGRNTYAGGSDKLGHVWATYVLARGTSRLMQWGGMRPTSAAILTSAMALGLFTYVEVRDGYYYQFSPGDQIGNTLGAGLSVLLETVPVVDRAIDFRVEYVTSPEYLPRLRNGDIDIAEDYSGQRYLLALHSDAVARAVAGREERWMRWLSLVDVTVGYETRKYKPKPADPTLPRTQHLFVGLAFNAQGAIDWALGNRRGAAETARKIGHGAFEVWSLPYTSLPIVSARRTSNGELPDTP